VCLCQVVGPHKCWLKLPGGFYTVGTSIFIPR